MKLNISELKQVIKKLIKEAYSETDYKWFWISPDNKALEVSKYGHEQFIKAYIYPWYDEESSEDYNNLFKEGWVRVSYEYNPDKEVGELSLRAYTDERAIEALNYIFKNIMNYNNKNIYIDTTSGSPAFTTTNSDGKALFHKYMKQNQVTPVMAEGRKLIKKLVTEELNSIKPGVDFVFEQHPELASIGTPQQYTQYLDTIFPDSKVKNILYHRTSQNFDKFDKSKIKNSNGARFYFSPINTGRYGNYVKLVILNIKNLAIPNNNDFINDVNKRHPEYTEGKSKYFNLPAQIYANADKYGYDGVYALEGTNDDEYSVYEPEQIHILGSKEDIEGFKRFVGNGVSESKTLTEEVKNKSRVYLSQNGNDGFGYVMNTHLKSNGEKIGSIVVRRKTYLKNEGYPEVLELHMGFEPDYQRQGYFQDTIIELYNDTGIPIYIAKGRVINNNVFKAINKLDPSISVVENEYGYIITEGSKQLTEDYFYKEDPLFKQSDVYNYEPTQAEIEAFKKDELGHKQYQSPIKTKTVPTKPKEKKIKKYTGNSYLRRLSSTIDYGKTGLMMWKLNNYRNNEPVLGKTVTIHHELTPEYKEYLKQNKEVVSEAKLLIKSLVIEEIKKIKQ